MEALRGRVVTPENVIEDGVLGFSGGVITHVGTWAGAPEPVRAAAPAAPRAGELLLPGLVDVHNHGGGGASIPDSSTPEEIAVAVAEHRRHGTTRMIASLVTAGGDALVEKVAMLADVAEAGVIAGIHLEGPFISVARCGAQNPAHITGGDPELTARVLRAGRGHVRTMTLAPETENLLGAGGVVDTLIAGGALPSFGHTDADAQVMRTALTETAAMLAGSGRRATVTHLFNGMRTIHHRDPGPVPPALAAAREGEVVVELVADGAHLHPELVTDVFTLAGSANIALVTDAMAAAGMADGAYRLGSLDVVVSGGIARLAEGGSIAGGTAHLLDVVRTSVRGGVGLVDAVGAASVVPAGVIDPDPRFGALRVGNAAEIVRTSADLELLDVVAPA
ncbi:amidohydrolase family protein [Pseudactinotalea sp. HY160]|uniref:N-acetylglucosamine-6-phosphate deacetylase n=1 Tax=Pseudactinotalea sp. HY160 TaxID=2654490 RepID=UPI0013113248|nr:amidohydrolase family protein [Pseudactinotalea sp. HY160]